MPHRVLTMTFSTEPPPYNNPKLIYQMPRADHVGYSIWEIDAPYLLIDKLPSPPPFISSAEYDCYQNHFGVWHYYYKPLPDANIDEMIKFFAHEFPDQLP